MGNTHRGRPEKLWSAKSEVLGKSTAEQLFRNDYLVSKEKIELCEKAHIADKRAAALSRPDSFSLYVSVPFCPSRCKYCSFVSHSIASAGKLVPDYVELLCKEIEATAAAAKNLGLSFRRYISAGNTHPVFRRTARQGALRRRKPVLICRMLSNTRSKPADPIQ